MESKAQKKRNKKKAKQQKDAAIEGESQAIEGGEVTDSQNNVEETKEEEISQVTESQIIDQHEEVCVETAKQQETVVE